jgi:hypothetical protein
MKPRLLRFGTAAFVLASVIGGAVYAQIAQRIYVGPNVRVSLDSEKSHFEPMIASAGGGLLIASTNLTGGDNDTWITKAYVSRDNGGTWFSVWIPRLIASAAYGDDFASGDSAVAAGARGRIFYAALCRPSDARSHELVTCLYHSDDRGRSWSPLQTLNIADHERFATDPASRLVLLVGKWSGKKDRLVMYVSHDNGGTFAGPFAYADVLGIAYDPCLLPDGTIFLPYVHETRAKEWLEGVLVRGTRVVAGPFKLYDENSPPLKVLIQRNVDRLLAGEYASEALDVFLSHGDRLYAIGSKFTDGTYRLVLRVSADRGRHWSNPRYVSAMKGMPRDQFAPSAAFNTHGILGIGWSEMIGSTHYDERFTVSLDGGKSFLDPRIISTQDSMPFNDENVSGQTTLFGKGSFFQYSGFTTRSAGGDYFGMTTDDAGVFHPLWVDSRDGVGAQLYTSAIAVLDRAPACAPLTNDSTDLAKTAKLIFDPARMSVATDTLTIPLRIENLGNAPITGPVSLTITALQTDEYIPPKASLPADAVPQILGASNGKAGVGATIDFSSSFGDYEQLPPGGVSNAVDLRIHLSNPLLADPVITGVIKGRICET